MRIVDLTHTFKPVMPVYPGDPSPMLKKVRDMDTADATDHELHTTMHVGTHVDAPLHMIPGGAMLSQIPAGTFVGLGVLVDARGLDVITAEVLDDMKIEPGSILLVMTGHSDLFGTDAYYKAYPQFDETFAERAVDLEVKMVGMDTPSPDSAPYAVHKILLKNNILIIENLTNLESLIDLPGFAVAALPMKVEADAGPIRVVAMMHDEL